MDDRNEFRVIQGGQVVSFVSSSNRDWALRSITHYAVLYSQEGSLRIEERINKKWKLLILQGCNL